MHIVITGTSRGIGLALARCALQAGHQLLAVARQADQIPALAALQREHAGRLALLSLDLREGDAAGAIASAAASRGAVDLLINNAGILREGVSREDFQDSFAVNTIVPFEVTQALLPALRQSGHPRVVHVTSRMGSVADNGSGGYYAYRASKSALNMINRSLSLDHEWLTSIVVHPGWAQTAMGGAEAPVTPEESAAGIWRLAEHLRRGASGSFFDYQGKELPW